MTDSSHISLLLAEVRQGNQDALDRLLPLVYAELRRIAGRYMRRERGDHTLQPTALVNEAYMRLVDQRDKNWQNRAHFFGIAASMMRRILVDYARSHGYAKRGGGARKLPLDDALVFAQEHSGEMIALDDALKGLAAIDPRKCQVVELRYFGGLTFEEVAEVLGISLITAKRDWSLAKSWLAREMSKGEREMAATAEDEVL
jgi:RNA polymerase sigma-70 factor, ECF subfamily